MIKVTLRNRMGGELDCRTVESLDEARDAIMDIVLNSIVDAGDRISIEDISDTEDRAGNQ